MGHEPGGCGGFWSLFLLLFFDLVMYKINGMTKTKMIVPRKIEEEEEEFIMVFSLSSLMKQKNKNRKAMTQSLEDQFSAVIFPPPPFEFCCTNICMQVGFVQEIYYEEYLVMYHRKKI